MLHTAIGTKVSKCTSQKFPAVMLTLLHCTFQKLCGRKVSHRFDWKARHSNYCIFVTPQRQSLWLDLLWVLLLKVQDNNGILTCASSNGNQRQHSNNSLNKTVRTLLIFFILLFLMGATEARACRWVDLSLPSSAGHRLWWEELQGGTDLSDTLLLSQSVREVLSFCLLTYWGK